MANKLQAKNKSEKNILRAELLIGHVLRIGVFICGFFIAIGLILTWVHPHSSLGFSPDNLYDLLHGKLIPQINTQQNIKEIFILLSHFDSVAFISFGLILLIALPIVRVVLTIYLFLSERDYLYFFLTSMVFAILISGLLLGRSH